EARSAVRSFPRPTRAGTVRSRSGARAAGPGSRARLQPVAPADVLPAAGRDLRPAGPSGARDLLDPAGWLDGLAAVRRDPRAAGACVLRPLGGPCLRRCPRAPA